MARNDELLRRIEDLERRVQRHETAIATSPFVSLPSHAPTGPSPEERAEIEKQAAKVREQVAQRPVLEHDGTVRAVRSGWITPEPAKPWAQQVEEATRQSQAERDDLANPVFPIEPVSRPA